MNTKNDKKYRIRHRNIHLMNILEEDYYVDLGVIDFKVLNRILNKELVSLTDIINMEILTDGIGKITGDPVSDIYYQLNYLINLRFKNSTCKFLLTCGSIKYYDDKKCEKYAPVVFIPFEFDYRHKQIIACSNAIINSQIIEYLSKQKAEFLAKHDLESVEQNSFKEKKELDEKIEHYYNQFLSTYKKYQISNSFDIDKLCVELGKNFNTSVEPNNYFTISFVKYNDFTTMDGYMSKESSINQMSEKEIVKTYFEKVKAVFPTNIDQKCALVRASDGDNFVVNGKLGSGKTYTAINMIADAISKGKHILYVNQDLDNIFDINKNLKYLGLESYVYNLSKNLRNSEPFDVTFDDEIINDYSSNILEDVFVLPNTLKQKIHGYKLTSILEYLAILRQEYPHLERIQLENTLEYHEVNALYKELEEIESCLSKIDPYATNIWHRLQTSHNNLSTNDIIERTTELQKVHLELYKNVEKFIKKYSLRIPESTDDLYKVLMYIYSFATFRPLPEWKSESIRKRMYADLKEIQELVDKEYILKDYYKKTINHKYQYGRAKEILDSLANNNISISLDYKATEDIYINRLLKNNAELKKLIEEITKSIEKINLLQTNILRIFRLSNLDDVVYEFLNSFHTYLVNNKIRFEFLKAYNNSTIVFMNKAQIISNAYKKYIASEKYLIPKLNHFENFTMDVIKVCLSKKNYEKAFSKFINYKIIKKDQLKVEDVIDNIQIYYENKNIVEKNLAELFTNTDFDAELIKDFVNFYDYVENLNMAKRVYLNSVINRLANEKNPNTYLKEVTRVLKDFTEECKVVNDIKQQLSYYKVIIDTTNIFTCLVNLKNENLYLKQVVSLGEELKHIFNNKTLVTAFDLLELITNDFEYDLLKDTIDKKESIYKTDLKRYYNGLETAINEISRTLNHYEEFRMYLTDISTIDNLFVNETFNEMLKDVQSLNQIYNRWNNHFRNFASCFRGSQPDITSNSFEYNKKLFQQFIDKKDQIDPILKINELTEGFLAYGLKNLFAGIRSCKYGKNVSKQFIYSVLMNNYDEALINNPTLGNIKDSLVLFDDYINFERNYCKKNIEELIKNAPDIKKTNSIINLKDFNNYNKIITSIYKNVNVFLCDLDIFNNNIDLSLFDLVIMDDVHLSQASDYNRIYETTQVVALGNKDFQTSVSNTLMRRLGNSCSIDFRRRYVYGNSQFNNEWGYNNQYIYSFENYVQLVEIIDFNKFVEDICLSFKENPEHIINVVIANESTRRIIYTNILKCLAQSFSVEEVTSILSYNIRILNALTEGNRYVNDIFIYYDDFKNLDDSVKELAFKNFIYAYDKVHLYYMKNKIESKNNETINSINHLIGNTELHFDTNKGIVKYMKEALLKKKFNVISGFGNFDLIIKKEQINAVIIIDKDNSSLSRFLDDYLYYVKEYENRKWNIIKVFSYDLFNDFDKAIIELVKEVK